MDRFLRRLMTLLPAVVAANATALLLRWPWWAENLLFLALLALTVRGVELARRQRARRRR